jgi:very-short-patch-repair endonuclease
MNLTQTITRLGHLATIRQLHTLGIGRRRVEAAIRSGELERIRPGWVGTRAATQPAVIAVLHGARLTAATALRAQGVWSGMSTEIHLQVPANAHRIWQRPRIPIAEFVPDPFSSRRTVTHWTSTIAAPADQPAWIVSTTEALLRFARCETEEQFAAAIESAVHTQRLTRRGASDVFHRLPRRFRPLQNRLTFGAGSGMETIARLRLEDAGFAVSEQVEIGPDRVDFVIDDWLAIELDGDKWHDPVDDRARTNRLIRAGYRVLRFGYVDVFTHWDQTLATIRAMMR